MGLGDSDKPPRLYSVADYAKTAIALLDELSIKQTDILGDHTGTLPQQREKSDTLQCSLPSSLEIM
jgi:hypothetical protein